MINYRLWVRINLYMNRCVIMSCPLCLNLNTKHYHQDKMRNYWQCQDCQLVFVKPEDCYSPDDEKAVYDLHENNFEDSGYRDFLNRLLLPLTKKLKPNARGLDFGSGPGPTISLMMAENGFKVRNYDLYYANNPDVFNQKYDFITCTEVIEHLYHPHLELNKLKKVLKPNGFLGIMTKRLIDHDRFISWHYKNDPTHVCFYSDETFEFIANYWGFDLELVNADSVILSLSP